MIPSEPGAGQFLTSCSVGPVVLRSTRELSVRRKLNAMPVVFKGRSVLLVDDSIVRGTTMSQIVDMVRRAGAEKVPLALTTLLPLTLNPQLLTILRAMCC